MQEIACPDGDGVEQEQRYVLHLTKRHDTLYYAVERGFHLIVERQFLTNGIEGYEYGNSADNRDDIACGREHSEDFVEACSRVRKESEEHRYLAQEGDDRKQENERRVNGTLCYDRSESLWE